ncbi:MAG: hypothetical protein GTO41_15950, partial [Burkholderiales bacterium]|nr:hypothetical protein [Burkholderiales bacterium]
MMKLAIVHYHLSRGGVAHVIANHLRGLNLRLRGGARQEVALLFGGRR